MKIAQIAASYYPEIGGVQTHVHQIAQGCAEAGDEVTVLTHQFDGSPAEEFIGRVRVVRFPLTVSLANYPFSLSMFRYIKSHATDFDILHAHSYHTLVGQAAIGCHVPFVFTPHYHGTGHSPFRSFLHLLYRPVGARQFLAADTVICVSDAERDLVVEDFPGIGRKTVTIPNGIVPRRRIFSNDSLAQRKPVVLTIGRLERYKNVDLIIDAFQGLQSSAVLVVVGDGPDRGRLERRSQANDLGPSVRFTGSISDESLAHLLATACVVTSASDHEAFGLTLADGLTSGARVVASAIPAHAELARLAGVDAPIVLVDPRDTKQFAAVLTDSMQAGPVPPGPVKLPTWTDVAAATRELYSQLLSRDCRSVLSCDPELRVVLGPTRQTHTESV